MRRASCASCRTSATRCGSPRRPAPADDWTGLAAGVDQPHARRSARVVAGPRRPAVRRPAPGVDRPGLDGRDVRLRRRSCSACCTSRRPSASDSLARGDRRDGGAVRLGSESRPRLDGRMPRRRACRTTASSTRRSRSVPRCAARTWCCRSRPSSRAKAACRSLGAEQRSAIAQQVHGPRRRASRSGRLEPAQFGGSPVAVNLVWLVAHTTVSRRPESLITNPESSIESRFDDSS